MQNTGTSRLGVKVAILVNVFLLAIVAGGGWYMADRQGKKLEMQFLDRGKLLSIIGAKSISRLMEEAVDNGVFTVADSVDTQYVEIPGFDPPKYHTKYDFYTDKAFLALIDEFLKDPTTLYAAALDVNGYVPTHNSIYQKPITGDRAKDLVGNRTKRIFNDPVGLKAGANKEPGFLQTYQRDTGDVIWDISTPIYVKGKHWGGFRVGFSIKTVEAAKRELWIQLSTIMAVILLASFISVFIVVNQALAPLRRFTQIAGELADGKLEQEIKSKSKDEIGQLANVLERLRFSLKVAMKKLGQS